VEAGDRRRKRRKGKERERGEKKRKEKEPREPRSASSPVSSILLAISSLARLTVNQLFHKLPLQVLQEEFFSPDLERLFPGGLEILFLADVGHEGVDLVALFDEPDEDA
jgi:hypothetical protein